MQLGEAESYRGRVVRPTGDAAGFNASGASRYGDRALHRRLSVVEISVGCSVIAYR